jgi:drug/metabolite transporter (DMT)-like permease
MTPTAVLLLAAAAALHAGWNLLTKRQSPTAAFFLLANLAGSLLLAPFLVFHPRVLPNLPAQVWGLLLATGFSQTVYYAALAGAYRAGDISVAYPLARSSPVIVVTAVSLLLGRGSQVSGQCVLGIALVVTGCFLIPMRRFADFRLANYLNPTCGLALLAACGTAGYSIIDDQALRLLRTAPAMAGIGNTPLTLVYACLEASCAALWLALLTAASGQGRADLGRLLRTRWPLAALIGATIYLTYALVLISMAFVSNVSYVVAFRQLSIPLGTLLGITALREPPHLPKLVGVAVMLAGLALVGTG